MMDFFGIASGAFLGTLAAMFFFRFLSDWPQSGEIFDRGRAPVAFGILAAIIFAGVTAFTIGLTTYGQLHSDFVPLILILTFAVLAYVGRVLRRPPQASE